ncbi:MAG: DNA polymerase III subunit beta [Mycoplasmataceae bacterium]|jgi:DNA polymerase-3 subunit beta|nr:DNA polymerase III subunit beta [Mycoplasmataceae bacterium]
MKFTIEKNELINLLKTPCGIINNNNINHILTGILIECKNNELIVISSNNNLSIKSTTKNLTIHKDGYVLIYGKLFYNIITKLKDVQVNFEVVDNSIVRISTPTFSSDLNLLDNVNYPLINFDVLNYNECEIPNPHLQKVINKLINTTNPLFDRVTPLNGILFDSTRLNDFLESVGTDGHHLSYIKTPYTGNKFKIVIGVDILRTLQELITKDNKIVFYTKNNHLIIKLNNCILNCRLLEGDYPSAIKAIETTQKLHFLVNKQEISAAIDRGVILASTDKKPTIVFNINTDLLKISCKSIEYGSSYEEIKIKQYSGLTSINVSFNIKYLSNLIKNVENDEILFEFTEANKHFFVKDLKDPNYLSLILPIRSI